MPRWLRNLLPPGKWEMDGGQPPSVYLTFDDGPHPTITPFVLDQLRRYDAKASFFCVGQNVGAYPEVYQRILKEGHRVGNHTYHHLSGWKTPTGRYVADVQQARPHIDSTLFRPPYGRLTWRQNRRLRQAGYEIIYWTLLTGDFDRSLAADRCLADVIRKIRPGDIVVFHDSEKARERLVHVLPEVLRHCRNQQWLLRSL